MWPELEYDLTFCKDGWNVLGLGVVLFYFAMIFAVHIAGWVCVVRAVNAYHHNQADWLHSGWRLVLTQMSNQAESVGLDL